MGEKMKVVFGEAKELLEVAVKVYAEEVTVEGVMGVVNPDDDVLKVWLGVVGKVQGELWEAVGEIVDGVNDAWKGFVREQGAEAKMGKVKVRLSKEDARVFMGGGKMAMVLDGGVEWRGWRLNAEEGEELVRMIQEGTKVPKNRVTWEG